MSSRYRILYSKNFKHESRYECFNDKRINNGLKKERRHKRWCIYSQVKDLLGTLIKIITLDQQTYLNENFDSYM